MAGRNERIETLREACEALTLDPAHEGYQPLLHRMADAHTVLLGEASHGTDEFYRIRAEITLELIRKHGFNAVAVEADWPDAYRANRFVRLQGRDSKVDDALSDFDRFPRWMWRNTVVAEFLDDLRRYNADLPAAERVGFYGLDLYSLFTSMEAVVDYLETVDLEAARRARYRYSCFDQFDRDPQRYGYSVDLGVTQDCEDEAVAQLVELREKAYDYIGRDGFLVEDEQFYAEQNAALVADAEEYYRQMFRGLEPSWNLRDRHMFSTLEALRRHLQGRFRQPKLVVWAHNSHLGDARATEMSRRGELNIGQLVRQEHGDAASSLGFTTAVGSVTASSNWGEPAEYKQVRPPLDGSVERLLHGLGEQALWIDTHDERAWDVLSEPMLERAIGVIYRPDTERISHYFHAIVAEQFDLLVHVDRTTALPPLEPPRQWLLAASADQTSAARSA